MESATAKRRVSKLALWSLILAVLSVPLYPIGGIPLAALILSILALARYDKARVKGRWMAIVGLPIALVFNAMAMAWHGHLGSFGEEMMRDARSPRTEQPQPQARPAAPQLDTRTPEEKERGRKKWEQRRQLDAIRDAAREGAEDALRNR